MLFKKIEDQYQIQNLRFNSISEKSMDFDGIFHTIKDFMKSNPDGEYRLAIGTDSQAHKKHISFVTGIVIIRKGKGAWGCIRTENVPRKMKSLREKISYETTLTEMIAYMFTPELIDELLSVLSSQSRSTFTLEGHIDVGDKERNATRVLVREMESRIRSMGLVPKIKPYSFVASTYANKHTK